MGTYLRKQVDVFLTEHGNTALDFGSIAGRVGQHENKRGNGKFALLKFRNLTVFQCNAAVFHAVVAASGNRKHEDKSHNYQQDDFRAMFIHKISSVFARGRESLSKSYIIGDNIIYYIKLRCQYI